jgi:hypothetical protein
MTDAFWHSIPLILTAIAGGAVLIIKELRTARSIDKNTDITKEGLAKAETLAKVAEEIHEKELNGGLAESRQLAQEKLVESEARKIAAEDRLREYERRLAENQTIANVRVSFEQDKRRDAEERLKDVESRLEKLILNGSEKSEPVKEPSQGKEPTS